MRRNKEKSNQPEESKSSVPAFVEIEGHSLGDIHEIQFARGIFEAECECSNPDGEGVGLIRFVGPSADDVRDQFEEHCDTLN